MENRQVLKAMLICFNGSKALLYSARRRHGVKVYRPIGGHIELFERSDAAVRREVREEVHSGISRLRPVAIFENIFWMKGTRRHEIDFMNSPQTETHHF